MPRAGLSTDGVVDIALSIVDACGVDALTLAAVAERAGVAPPSLYKHVANLAVLRSLVAERVIREMTAIFAEVTVGRSRDDAVAVLMRTYRRYVVEHPARYATMPFNALQSDGTAAAGAELLAVFLAVLRGYGLDDSTATHATRCLRAMVHGFASIEVGGGFGLNEDVESTYDRLVGMFLASLPRT